MTTILKRAWIPLVIMAVVLVATFTVMRVHTFFGRSRLHSTENSASDEYQPFDPGRQVRGGGEPGATANVDYMDLDPSGACDNVTLPWRSR